MKPPRFSLELMQVAMLGIFLLAAARVSPDADTWWHLRAGQWMVEHHQLLSQDLFSYTRLGQPWEVPGWPVEVAMYLIYRLGGIGYLNLWTASLFTLTFYFVGKSLCGNELLKGIVLLLGAAASSLHASARPALVTLLFTAIFLWVLEDYRWGRAKRLWLLPLVMVVWVNSHAMFVLGIALVGLYAMGSTRVELRDSKVRLTFFPAALFGMIAILALSACLNPYGVKMLVYPFNAAAVHWETMQHIQEWQSPDFHRGFIQPFVWLLFLVFATAGISGKRIGLTDILLVSVFAYLGLYSARNVALFGLAAPIVLMRFADPSIEAWGRMLVHQTIPSRPALRKIIVYAVLVLLVFVGIGRVVQMLPEQTNLNELEKAGMIPPNTAVALLQADQPAGRLFNSYNWGGYLQWALPEYPLFVDGRADLFQDEIIRQWFQVALVQEGWQEVLERWDIHLVFIERTWPIVRALELAGWQLVYQDNVAAIYQHGLFSYE